MTVEFDVCCIADKRIQQFHFDPVRLRGFVAAITNLDRNVKPRVPVIVVKVTPHEKISNVHRRPRAEIHTPVDPAEPPHILIFEIAAVAPPVHFNGQGV